MADLIYLAVIIGFFTLAALFVVACDRIVGTDEVTTSARPSDGNPEPKQEAA